MATATAALIVSITSAAITLIGIVWQLTLYRLSGARLRVQLAFEFREGTGSARAVTNTRRRPRRALDEALGHVSDFGIECARIRVTNIGRTPVSVEDIALDLGRSTPLWQVWRWRRWRRTVVPMFFIDPNDQDNSQAARAVRLEAGAVTSRVVHLDPGILPAKKRLVVRGTATAAGRRPRRSPLKRAWRFKAGDMSWFKDYEVTPDVRVYRELWQHSYGSMVGGLPVLMHWQIMRQLRDGASAEEIEQYLKGLGPPGYKPPPGEIPKYYGGVARDVHRVYHEAVGGQATPPTSESAQGPDVGEA